MEYYVNSKSEEETIYEIYKACRLCGAGAGYKMPIIQNVVNLAPDEIELKQKIRECVQIEVHQDDKMPPLICELCVDKVNDFYEFTEMCKQTNKKTRLRLGLPPQTLPRGAPDAGDCILGITEPVFITDNSNEPILSRPGKSSKVQMHGKKKNQHEQKVNTKHRKMEEPKISRPDELNNVKRGRKREPTPPRSLRGTKRPNEDNVVFSNLQKTKKSESVSPKPLLKRSSKVDYKEELLEPRGKRKRESVELSKKEQNKKVKIPQNIPKKAESKPAPSPPPGLKCTICKNIFRATAGLISHMKTHTNMKAHKSLKSKPALPPPPPPSPKPEQKPKTQTCTKCDRSFPIAAFKSHKCSPKRELECRTCKRKFQMLGALTNHEKACKLTGKPKIPRWLKAKLLPVQVRLIRCDSLFDAKGHCHDVSDIANNYGLDRRCEYPYLSRSSKLRIKSELSAYNSMVKIQDDLRDEFDLDDCYVHWDSASETDSDTEVLDRSTSSAVKPLSTLSLKVLFSPKVIGKVPKKLKKLKSEKPFDSILNSTDLDSDITYGINNIINSLDDSINDNDNMKDSGKLTDNTRDEDALFGDNKGPAVKNSDFDLLFGNDDSYNKDFERDGSPALDISDIDNRLSQTNVNNTNYISNENSSSVNNSENAEDNIETESQNNPENDRIDNQDSSVASTNIENNIVTEDNNLVAFNEDIINENNENRDNISNESINTNDVESKTIENNIESKENKDTALEDRDLIKENFNNQDENDVTTEEYNSLKNNNEHFANVSEDNFKEDINIIDRVVDHKISNDEDDIIDYSKKNKTGSESAEITENCAQKEVHGGEINKLIEYQSKDGTSTNGDSEFPDKFNMDDLEAISDTDMDDRKLMAAIDAQLGESDDKTAMADDLSSKVNQQCQDFTKDILY